MPSRDEWLKERKSGIGGSDASAIMGFNPYKSNIDLWEEKLGISESEDISDKPYVKYGIDMENILRESFKVKHPELIVEHEENTIIRHKEYPFLFASLDGKITDTKTGKIGILEIKTSDIRQSMHKEKWKGDNIPWNYYTQVLHYMNVVNADFAYLFAELTYDEKYQANKTYFIDISDEDVKESIRILQEKEIEFWKCVEEKRRPSRTLPTM